VNLRKLYVADHALATAFDSRARGDLGHHLENVVACELLRRGHQLAYVKTPSGHEVDFLATARDGSTQLVQVTADVLDPKTLERELRALEGAREEFPDAEPLLLLGNEQTAAGRLPKGVRSATIWRWLLTGSTS
jgi:predicted AAA+ superfamily ATPase